VSLCQSGNATSKSGDCERAARHKCGKPEFSGTGADRAGAKVPPTHAQDFDSALARSTVVWFPAGHVRNREASIPSRDQSGQGGTFFTTNERPSHDR
jgi:hypothetical protein